MSLEKVTYIGGVTVISADNLNDIQDAIIDLQKNGGSSTNNAVIVARKTGAAPSTITAGSACVLAFTWSSTEDDAPTGSGTLTVRVGGVTKAASRTIAQGTVTLDVSPWLAVGDNTVQLVVHDAYDNARTLNYSVSVVSLSIASTFDASQAYSGDVSFPYTPVGDVEKTVYFELDGAVIGTENTSYSGRQLTRVLSAGEFSHGSHVLRVWFTATVNGDTVSSNVLTFDIIYTVEGNTTPIITWDLTAASVEQYAALPIHYYVYDPESWTAEATIYVNDEAVSTVTVDRTEQTYSYRAMSAGDVTISIASGAAVKTAALTVTASEIDVSAETQDLALYLTGQGRSNSEANPASWVFGDISATLTGFNFTSDGWLNDADGNDILRVTGNARVSIPYKVFQNDFRGTGKTIELEFATRDVRDYDAAVISCMSGGRGFQVTAQQALLRSEQTEIFTPYKEDEHIRVSFVVEKRVENRLMSIYINGILSGVTQYPVDDDFAQGSPVDISIGSSDCTVDVYGIRIYDNDLTRYQLVNNWIADTPDVATMLARYEHNDVYDAYGNIVTGKLPDNLPYLVVECEDWPQFKGDKKTASGYYIDPADSSKSFRFEGAEIDVQGTSSQFYAVKNIKSKFKGGFTDGDGGTSETYAMRDGAVPTATFTFKADVASSEGANNVELARLYNDICPYKTPPQEENAAVRQGIDGFPIVMFWTHGETTEFLGKYNFNNDKGTAEVFGFSPGDQSWEIKNNTSNRVVWKRADYAGDGWQEDFEGRYPDGNTDPEKLAAFAAWIVSTDRDVATDEELEEPVTIDGETYTTDSAAYRLAKFKSELSDHAAVDSAVFYYLFTELFLMVDSRAKNAFPTIFDAEGKWCWLPYDFDTALGINNEGALAFDYSLEDTDTTASGANVFNGQDSVFWRNLRDAFSDEISEMYKSLRTSGALSYPVVEGRFEEHQNKWPEAVFNEDAYYKYIQPLVDEGTTTYLAMCQGSKAEQRKWWLYNRFLYMDSKYNTGDAKSDTILLRGYAKADITVTPYASVYAAVMYGQTLVSSRALRGGGAVTLACPLDSVNDTEIAIYSASQLADVGDLSGLKVGQADFSRAASLTRIIVGSGAAGYENGNLTELSVGENKLLRTLDARNCTALTGSIDLSGCAGIQTVYLDNTAVTGVSLPNGGVLKTLHLPATVTNLTIRNQPNLTDFAMAGYANLTTLRIENAGENIPVGDILNALPSGSRVRLVDSTWTFAAGGPALTFLENLASMKGLDANGNNTDHAVISGTVSIGRVARNQLAAIDALIEDNVWTDLTVVYTEMADYVTAELSVARYYAAGASVGDYALCMGGTDGTNLSNVVDAYTASLTHSVPTVLSSARSQAVGASVGGYALCMGGVGASNRSSVVDAYDTSLTRSLPTPLSSARSVAAGASVGDYALCMGGYDGSNRLSTVNAYNASLTRSSVTVLSKARSSVAGASVGDYALCMGGYDGSTQSNVVDAYNKSLTRSTATSLSSARSEAVGASVGNYALCMGGSGTGSNIAGNSDVVDAYNASLTRSIPPTLSAHRRGAGASTPDYALCMGGYPSRAVVDAYDASLTRTLPSELPYTMDCSAGVGLGTLAFCMGGSPTRLADSVVVYNLSEN